MAGRISLLPLAGAALHATSASAIVYIMPTDESMVNRSPLIVFGEVRSAGPGERRGRPATNYVLDVEEVLKGAVGGATIIVQQPGGVDDNGVASWIMGLPMLAKDDRVLLFLRPEEQGVHRVVEYALGMFWEVDAGGRRLLLREPSLEGEAGVPTLEPEESRPPREADSFRRWVADRAAGLERPADYFAAEPPNGPVALVSPYRVWRVPDGQEGCLAGLEGLPLRWREFDRDESLGFVVHAGGQPGVPGGGLRQVRAGMRIWNDDARSRVALAVLGETSDLLRFSQRDGTLSIMFEDPHDEIEGRLGDDGGTLAVTRALAAHCDPHRIPGGGEEAVALSETGIVTQDGLGDRLRSGEVANPGNYFERIIAHELGHAIAIGHPCEIEEADCDDSHPHRGALMYPTADSDDGSRARLHGDDRAAVRYLYPSGGGGTPQPPPDPDPDPDPPPPSNDRCTLTDGTMFDCHTTADGHRYGVQYFHQGGWRWAEIGVQSGDSAVFHFFGPDNLEVFAKVLNGCAIDGSFWVYASGLTDLPIRLQVWQSGDGAYTLPIPDGAVLRPNNGGRLYWCGATRGAALRRSRR
ncbi:MAG: hypothetical protein OXH70_14005 [Acidobacteria bacterium]|nr:hypothetical protein [Acidobacteriota bacterium]